MGTRKGYCLRPLEERFWEKVDKSDADGCWLWTATRACRPEYESGYGRIYAHGKARPAAQVAWELANGQPFPEGMLACHHCDNPPCVRPDHIFPGTNSDNINDAVNKGRWSKGPALRPYCKYGHLMEGDNVFYSRTRRRCRQCRRVSFNKYKAKRKIRDLAEGRPKPTVTKAMRQTLKMLATGEWLMDRCGSEGMQAVMLRGKGERRFVLSKTVSRLLSEGLIEATWNDVTDYRITAAGRKALSPPMKDSE
jgi:hypothetical protein